MRWGEGPRAIQAQKKWPTAAEHLLLKVSLGDTSIFRFPEGEMASGYVARESTKHVIMTVGQDRSKRAIEESKHPVLGVGEFYLRAICSLAKSTSIKYGVWLTTTIMAFPGSMANLVSKSVLACKASWPGVKLAEGDINYPLPPSRPRERDNEGQGVGMPHRTRHRTRGRGLQHQGRLIRPRCAGRLAPC